MSSNTFISENEMNPAEPLRVRSEKLEKIRKMYDLALAFPFVHGNVISRYPELDPESSDTAVSMDIRTAAFFNEEATAALAELMQTADTFIISNFNRSCTRISFYVRDIYENWTEPDWWDEPMPDLDDYDEDDA